MRLTGRDVEILRYAARHGAVTAEQVRRVFFGAKSAAYQRLRKLTEAGYLRHDMVLFGEPGIYRVSQPGARLAGTGLGPARIDAANLSHHLEVVNISEELLNEHPGSEWVTEREIRSNGIAASERDESGEILASGGAGTGGRTPDGVLLREDGQRVAVEYENKQKNTKAYEKILVNLNSAFHGGDYEGALFIFASERALERVRELAEKYGLEDRIEFRSRTSGTV